MTSRKKMLRNGLAAVLALPALAAGGASLTEASASAADETPYPKTGSVAVYRDEWGVPHVYAKKEEDGFFGAGYALAEDNLVKILTSYVQVAGRSAAAFGDETAGGFMAVMGRNPVDGDFSALHWRFAEDAKAAYGELPGEMQANYRAFIDGVKQYMDDNPDRVPEWAPRLEPWMPIAATHALVSFIAVFQTGQGFHDCGLNDPRAASLDANPGGSLTPFPASNQWVIAPDRTQDGHLINWADSHSPFATDRDELRLHAGNLHTTGIVQTGTLVPLIGHNENVAWSFTVGGPDVSDCYAVAADPDNPGRYRFDGEWKEFITKKATVKTKDGRTIERDLEYTDHNGQLNPVIMRRENVAYVIGNPHMGAAAAAERTIYGMNTAQDIDEFIDALAHRGMFPENIMAGDRKGETYYVSIGRPPRRKAGVDASKVLDGNTSATLWDGLHEMADLIQMRNPKTGWMQNNNIAPDTIIPNSPLTADRYPSYLFNNPPGRTNERGERAKALLGADKSVSLEDAIAYGMDEFWPHTPQWRAALKAALAESGTKGGKKGFAARLLTFDGVASKSSVPALNWYYWRLAVAELADKKGRDFGKLADAVKDGKPLAPEERALLVDAVAKAEAAMRARFGSIDAAFGEVFRVGRGDVSLPLGGVSPRNARIERTLRSMRCEWNEDASQCFASSGQRHPMLTVFSDPLQSFSAVPFGQNSDPASPHHADQSTLASEARLKPIHFHWDDLAPNVKSKKILVRNKK